MAANARKRSEPAKGTKSRRGQGVNGPRTAAAVVPAPAAPYEPTPRERAALEHLAERGRRTTPTPRMKIAATPDRTILPDHADRACASALLADTFGTADGQFVEGLLLQLSNVPRPSTAERELNFMLSLVRGIGPKDETEALLATQMAAIHHATMVAAHRLQRVDNIPQQDSASNMLNKLARTFVGQVEALKNYRSSGEQHIRVQHQHVTVNDGGQAIVAGQIQQGGEGGAAKNRGQPLELGTSQASGAVDAPRCSAQSKRSGSPCRAPAVRGWSVCRCHGARGGAPKGTANGAWRDGRYSNEAIAMRRHVAELVRQVRATIARVG